MKLNSKQRDSLARVLYDFAKYTFAGLVLAQIIAAEKFKLWVLILGIAGILTFVSIGLLM